MNVKITYRRKRSGISMRATRKGEISVSAPLGCSRRDVERFIIDHHDWIEQALAAVKRNEERRRAFFNRLPCSTRQERDAAKASLDAIVKPLLTRHSAVMGVMPESVSYRLTTSRWGSCNPYTRKINLSLYLLLLPEWCIEHVVVHELAHLRVPDHSVAFKRLMDKHFPRWREARAETRRITRC